jgi:hypothetical protein
MSRARPIYDEQGDPVLWFDTSKNGHEATDSQVELLGSVLGVDLDDLLDASLSQGDVLGQLREELGQGVVPEEVLVRQRAARAERKSQPECRICDKTGNSTRHHYVNRWMMRELSNYHIVGARSRCTIPVCTHCHRKLHDRSNGPVSIVPYLTDDEKAFACDLLERFRRERPSVFELQANGDPSVYEACLVQDWIAGKFDVVLQDQALAA